MNTSITTLPYRCASCTLKSLSQPSRPFSSSTSLLARKAEVYVKRPTQLRQKAYRWLYEGPGANFIEPIDGLPNYLGSYALNGVRRSSNRTERSEELGEDNRTVLPIAAVHHARRSGETDYVPFPTNPHFESQPVLSDEVRDKVYEYVVKDGHSLKAASYRYNISVERAGAIIRLKAVEKQWAEQGKPFAHEYARAVTSMLPITNLNPQTGIPFYAHESIHDLPVQRTTKSQLFHVTSESHQLSRKEAGNIFERGLPPADERIHHVEAVRAVRELHAASTSTSTKQSRSTKGNKSADIDGEDKTPTFDERLSELLRQTDLSRKIVRQKRADAERKATTEVQTQRALFKFKDVLVDYKNVKQNGRGEHAIGERYGAPHMDRKRGLVKIIKKVI